MTERTGKRAARARGWLRRHGRRLTSPLVVVAMALVLYLFGRRSGLLFHAFAEIFAVAISFGIFILIWNSRHRLRNGFILIVGIGFLFVGVVDLLHTFAYPGMGILERGGTDLATQLWIAARLLQGSCLLMGTGFIGRRAHPELTMLAFAAATGLLLASILALDVFPSCHDDEAGRPTPFKVACESVVCALLAAAAVVLWVRREHFERRVLGLLIASLVLFLLSELIFTSYAGPFDDVSRLGYVLKILAFYILYKALVETGFRRPYDLIFNELKRSEEAYRELSEALERRIRERTIHLAEAQRIGRLGSWVFDVRDGSVTWSEELHRILGIPPGDPIDYPTFLSLVHPADREELEKAVDDALYRNRPYVLEHRVVRSDGEVRILREHGEVTRAESGEPVRMFGVAQDVTELRDAERTRAQLATVIESSDDGAVIADTEGRIVYVNPAFERLTGYSRREAIGRDHLFTYPESEVPGLRRRIAHAVESGIRLGERIRVTRPDGSSYVEEFTVTAVRDEEGETINLLGFRRDITDRLALESAAEATTTMANIGYIFSGIRHEMGNPVNSVRMTLDMLRQNAASLDRETIAKYLGRAHAELGKIAYLLGTLKTFSLYERPLARPLDVGSFVGSFDALTRSDCSKRGIGVSSHVEPGTGEAVADARALQQALMSVIANAMDALADRPEPRIDIRAHRDGAEVVIEVEDTGEGIEEGDLDNVFKPFYTTRKDGTGLGLVLARRMITSMHGTIEVDSEAGRGTTVRVRLPGGPRH